MTNKYELETFKSGIVGFVVTFLRKGKFCFNLETRVFGEYVSINGCGYDTEEDALNIAFNTLEGKFDAQERRERATLN